MAGVITQRNGFAVGCAQSALRAENEKLFAEHRGGRPAHAGVLRPAEEITTRHAAQAVGIERQAARRTRSGGAQRVDRVVAGI